MEESIKRKERLSAMRMEASEDGVGGYGGALIVSQNLANPLIETNSDGVGYGGALIVSQNLANPLIETNSVSSMGSEPHAAARFDYYTDPLAAFSSNKRGGSKVSHQFSPDFTAHPSPANPGFIRPRPTAQQSNSTPDLRPFQAQGPYYRSPGSVGTPNPYNAPRGIISHWGRPGGSTPNFFPNASPGFGQVGRPSFNYGQGNANPGFGQWNRPSFNYGQGRGYRFDNSHQAGSGLRGGPYHNSGSGRSSGRGSSGSPGFKQSGSHNDVSAEVRPDRYYKKSMVEDPWKRLKPILWKHTDFSSSSTDVDGPTSWLPKSLGSKKPRVSVKTDKNKSGQSLAEYLAASFNEATNETDDNDDRLNV